jgi:hypothetical protein
MHYNNEKMLSVAALGHRASVWPTPSTGLCSVRRLPMGSDATLFIKVRRKGAQLIDVSVL